MRSELYRFLKEVKCSKYYSVDEKIGDKLTIEELEFSRGRNGRSDLIVER